MGCGDPILPASFSNYGSASSPHQARNSVPTMLPQADIQALLTSCLSDTPSRASRSVTTFCDVMHFSPVNVHRRFGGTHGLHLISWKVQLAVYFLLITCLAHTSTLQMDAEHSPETSVNYWTKWFHTLQESTLYTALTCINSNIMSYSRDTNLGGSIENGGGVWQKV